MQQKNLTFNLTQSISPAGESFLFPLKNVWQISLALSDVIYELIKLLPKEADFNMIGLNDQRLNANFFNITMFRCR